MKEEAKIERAFSFRLRAKGALVIKLQGLGLPDRMVVYRGQVHFIEFKSSKGKLSAIQKELHIQFKKNGYIVHVINNHDDANRLINEVIISCPTN